MTTVPTTLRVILIEDNAGHVRLPVHAIADTHGRTVIGALRYAIERQHALEQIADAHRLEATGQLADAVADEHGTLRTTALAFAGCDA